MQNDKIKNVQPLLQQHNVSSSCGDTPYTKNTKEIRKFLEEREYFPLRFFQGGEYIYPIVSTMANAQSTWKVKDYSTFDESKKINMPYLMDSPLSEEDFKLAIIKADSNYS